MALKVEFKQKLFSPAVERAVSRLAAGASVQDAASELHRDKETVKSYATVFRQTMQAKSMVEAVAKAVARGVISIKEIDGKTLIACGLISLSSFHTDYVMARSVRTTKTTRHDNADTPSEQVSEVFAAGFGSPVLCTVVPGGLSDRAVW